MATTDPARERALYIISVAAELAGVHAQTLRIYERKGLIEPQRTTGGSRRYSDGDIALLRRIQELTNEGVSLVGVRKVLELEEELTRARARIAELQQALDRAREDLVAAVEAAHREHRRDLVPAPHATVERRSVG
jgi:MerR family transcriptional regulator, heat shock protein HspR